jgi:two-component system chemotaxis sensor kinase CheA
VQVGAERMGLIVDAIIEEEDMVIKSLPGHMKNVRLISGVTISGRNEIINILNVPIVMEVARRNSAARSTNQTEVALQKEISILVVDDSMNTREIEKSILEAYGYKVTIAGDGEEALKMAGEAKYDLVITDVEMPRLDGFSLTERLRSDAYYRDVPIIIVTSRESDQDKRRGIAVGANAYIVKGSFDQSNLVETVHNLVGKGEIA